MDDSGTIPLHIRDVVGCLADVVMLDEVPGRPFRDGPDGISYEHTGEFEPVAISGVTIMEHGVRFRSNVFVSGPYVWQHDVESAEITAMPLTMRAKMVAA
jgi:hypothetical protein